MSTDPQTQPHPTSLSDDAIKALRESDPAAFDEDGDTPPAAKADDPPADPPAAKADEAGKADEPPAAAAATDEGAGDGDGDDKGKPRLIPEARLGEVVSERNELRSKLEAYEAAERAREEAVRQAMASRDYAKEIGELDQKWDDGDFEGEFKDYQAEREKIVADRERARILAENDQREAQAAADKAERDWAEAKTRFFATPENAALVDGKVRVAAFSAAIEEAAAAGFKDFDELLTKAANLVAPVVQQPPDPHAPRRAADAKAASAASNTPPPVSGGVGNRASVDGGVDLSSMKPGKFSSLPKDKQEELLGEGAL